MKPFFAYETKTSGFSSGWRTVWRMGAGAHDPLSGPCKIPPRISLFLTVLNTHDRNYPFNHFKVSSSVALHMFTTLSSHHLHHLQNLLIFPDGISFRQTLTPLSDPVTSRLLPVCEVTYSIPSIISRTFSSSRTASRPVRH